MLYVTMGSGNGPLTRYVKLRVVHAPGMPGTFSPSPNSKGTDNKRSRNASRHVRHARAVMQVGIANPWWRGKRSRHSRCMRNPQFYISGKRPMPFVMLFDEARPLQCFGSANQFNLICFIIYQLQCEFSHASEKTELSFYYLTMVIRWLP